MQQLTVDDFRNYDVSVTEMNEVTYDLSDNTSTLAEDLGAAMSVSVLCLESYKVELLENDDNIERHKRDACARAGRSTQYLVLRNNYFK